MSTLEALNASGSSFDLEESLNQSLQWNSTPESNSTEWDWLWGEEAPFLFPTSFRIAAHIAYNIVLILGLIGNGCALLIFTVRKPLNRFRKLPTPLLANLAVGDLLITLFCLETSYLSLLWQYWPFGRFLCFALSPVKSVAVFVSCYTLIALSVDRYISVKDPLKSKLSNYHVRWIIALIWLLAVVTAVPTGLFTAFETHLLTGLPRCGEYAWESEWEEITYDIALITLQFFIPVIVLIFTYTKISILVWNSRQARTRMCQGMPQKQKSYKTVRMSLMVVLGYTFAWFPYNAVSILVKYNRAMGESDDFPYIFVACHWLAMSHAVYNPIIYFWLNKSFRFTVLEQVWKKKALQMRKRMSSINISWKVASSSRKESIQSQSRRESRIRSLQLDSYANSPLLKENGKVSILEEIVEANGH